MKLLKNSIIRNLQRTKWSRYIYKKLQIMKYKYMLYFHSFHDLKRYAKYSFKMNKKIDKENLIAEITYNYHAIEKGLSNRNIRIGFGNSAINNLLKLLNTYKNSNFDINNERIDCAISVLENYCKIHEYKYEYTNNIKNFIRSFNNNIVKEKIGGSREHLKDTILANRNKNFMDLLLSRVSIRDYDSSEVDIKIVYKSLKLAMRAPSVCNRQPWRVYLIKNYDTIVKTLTIQGGMKGSEQNIKYLLLITANLKDFKSYEERNQAYVDGGIYLITLVYSLTYYGMATCILNADFEYKREKQIRKILNVKDNDVLIGFISVGNYKNKFKTPISHRDSYEDHIYVLE